jgi:hypothetical protein
MRYCKTFGNPVSSVVSKHGWYYEMIRTNFGAAFAFGFAGTAGFFGATFFLGAGLRRRLSEIAALC